MKSVQQSIVLYRGFRASPSFTWSPFVTKLEFRLRHANLPYKNDCGAPSSAPNGKIPYVDISPLTNDTAPELLSDSTMVISNLVARSALPELNSSLTATEKALDLSIRALLEDKFYFLAMNEKWIDNFYIQRDKVLSTKPWPVRYIIGILIYRKVQQTIHLQGSSRYSTRERNAMIMEILETIETLLKESKAQHSRRKDEADLNRESPFWIVGRHEPSEADATVFGFIVSILLSESGPTTRKVLMSMPTMLEYADRIQRAYFLDYDEIL